MVQVQGHFRHRSALVSALAGVAVSARCKKCGRKLNRRGMGRTSCKLCLFCQRGGVDAQQQKQARRPGEEREICDFWLCTAVYGCRKRWRPAQPANQTYQELPVLTCVVAARRHMESNKSCQAGKPLAAGRAEALALGRMIRASCAASAALGPW